MLVIHKHLLKNEILFPNGMFKDMRLFQHSYGLHIKMAQLEQNIWAMVEDVSDSGVKITEKFFRPLMKLSSDGIKTCLDILRRQGLAIKKCKLSCS